VGGVVLIILIVGLFFMYRNAMCCFASCQRQKHIRSASTIGSPTGTVLVPTVGMPTQQPGVYQPDALPLTAISY
jgi:hypothetical protein